MTAAIDDRAVALGYRLAHLLLALDPKPTTRPLLAVPISTHDGFSWDVELSEAAVERLTRLMEAADEPTPTPTVRHLRLVAS
ncbi:hypothetical protein [Streptomyces sp.]|uniref:hypothetical protein n=1 Tax=Streptomyces sp. TaxID=1931 RepID=UPI002F9567B7